MRVLIRSSLATALLASAAAAHAADPAPSYLPAPAWVEPVKVPPANPKLLALPAQLLVLNVQEKFAPDHSVTYLEYVAVPQTVAGLQSIGNISLPWNVERADLAIHRLEIDRNGKIIDAYDQKALMVLRQEANLDKAILDGGRTVILPLRGVQLGDKIRVAASYTTKKSSIALRTEQIATFAPGEAINLTERRVLVPDGMTVRWYRSTGVPEPTVTKANGMSEFRFAAAGAKPREWPEATPQRFRLPIIQATAWTDWNEVASSMIPLYTKARVIKDGSPLALEADKIAASTSDPERRTLAALRLAQEQVRYVALLLGEGAYVPISAEDTWGQRFGDCKGKTVLLLGLLDRLGIPAHPMLVSSAMDGLLPEMLPSLAAFDHVIVRATVGGKTLYLDPTGYGQRTISELERTSFIRGLPLTPASDLLSIPLTRPTVPQREAELVWDGRQGFERKVPFTATLILRGEEAAAMRASKAVNGDAEEHLTKLKNYVPGVGNELLELKSEEPEQADGTYRATFAGTAAMDWSPIEGRKGYRYELSQSTVRWEFDAGRTEAPDRDVPLSYSWPYHAQSREIILLPNEGKGFKADAALIDRRFAGVHVTRSLKIEGNKAVAVSTFVHEKQEVDAAEARTIKDITGEINKQFAYVVAPGRIRAVAETEK